MKKAEQTLQSKALVFCFDTTLICIGFARTGRRSKPLPCGHHSHAMHAENKSHALGQVGREQGVDVVIYHCLGYEGKAQILGVAPPPSNFEDGEAAAMLIGGITIFLARNYFKNQISSGAVFSLYPK